MPTFQDRQEAIGQILTESKENFLLEIFGEAGIGKSRLLEEAMQQIRTTSPPALVLSVNLEPLVANTPITGQPEQVLQLLMDQIPERPHDPQTQPDQLAGMVVKWLNELGDHGPVYLIFDTTEVLQENVEFRRWIEVNLVSPLVLERKVRQVFAGRVPVPWRRIEVRREVKLLRLDPLAVDHYARELVLEVLQTGRPELKEAPAGLETAVDLVLEFSCGHPLLSEQLAAYVAAHWPLALTAGFKQTMCQEVVKPFIEQHFFSNIDPPWNEILWWISVLDHFDAALLQRYLNRVAPTLIKDQPDYFFIQGLTRLRVHHTVVWNEVQGDRLHGVIAQIVPHCLEVLDPERYQWACQAAAEMLEEVAQEFKAEEPEAQRYRDEAQHYRQRIPQEVIL